jgi:hypothetical protein
MKHYFILILLVAALSISGCESDTPSSSSTNSLNKELEIVPTNITVSRYEEFTIKARMTNIPLSDVYMRYDFGDGRGAMNVGSGGNAFHFYLDTGNYTITITAYDGFTDSLLATKTIPARVNELPHSVKFTSDAIDTIVGTDKYGNLPYITFQIKTNAPSPIVVWNVGDGSPDTTIPYGTSLHHRYKSVGTYTVTVDVYDNNSTYWGSDTMLCTVKFPNITTAMLTGAKRVTIIYEPDETSELLGLMKYYPRFETGLYFVNDYAMTYSWYGNTFDVRRKLYSSDVGTPLMHDHHISGKVSTDFRQIDEITVSYFDSITASDDKNINRYGYTLFGLELFAVTSDLIVYRAEYKPLSEFVRNEYFREDFYSNGYFGSPDPHLSSHIVGHTRNPPYAYVAFSR